MSKDRPGWPVCAYYEPDREGQFPGAPADAVFSDGHDAGPGPLYFFVPVADGCAVRVPVCERHAEILRKQFAVSPT